MVSIGFLGAALLLIFFRLLFFLHMLQLEGYRTGRFARWLVKNPNRMLAARMIKDPKKKFVLTARATRLMVLTLTVLAFVLYGLSQLSFSALFLGSFLAWLLMPALVISTNTLIHPLEMMIHSLYFRSARKKITELKPKVIAITGSYGKTSTKDFLASILGTRYRVLKTPGSFNTPMGLCKVIREELRKEHRIFIVEMGARQKGDIRELCELVRPEVGILTSIGPQHLETFKTMDNILAAKYELIECLTADGIAVFNYDDENCRALAQKTIGKKVVGYGTRETNGDGLHLRAKEVSVSPGGISFVAQRKNGEAAPFFCRLLGKHQVHNILAAATVASELGMTLQEIAEGVKKLEPSAHRLQVMEGRGGITILDDAYNANPVGAREALEVLSEFKGGRKVLVTPGLVELGDREEEENKKLGSLASRVCDLVFLIGPKRTRAIFEGLRENGFPEHFPPHPAPGVGS